MSTELVVGLLGLGGVLITTAAEVWKMKRRRGESSGESAAQAAQLLREEAAEALVEVPPVVHRALEAEPDTAAREALQQQVEKLFRLRARLGVASGISNEELDAFTKAAMTADDLVRGVDGFDRELRQVQAGELDDAAGFDRAREIVESAEVRFREAWERFETAAHAAATNHRRR